MQERSENRIPKDTEDALNRLVEDLENHPSKTNDEFFPRITAIITLLDSIKTYDLLCCLFRVKVFEWILHEALQFKQNYANSDLEINNMVVIITEFLLINLKASLLLNSNLESLPDNLPEFILDNVKTPQVLSEILDNKYEEFFSFYAQKTQETDVKSKISKMNFFYSTAKKHIELSNTIIITDTDHVPSSQ